MAPDAAFAIYFAKTMMQQNIGRAGEIGRGKGTDDTVIGEQGFHGVGLKPPVKKLHRA